MKYLLIILKYLLVEKNGKGLICTFFIIMMSALACFQANAQSFYGNEWYLGIRNYKLSFNLMSTTISYLNDNDTNPHITESNSNICDSNGHLLIATDGISLLNSDGEFIAGGGHNINNDSIVWGEGHDTGYLNTSIVLPKKNNQYYVFICTISDPKYNHWYYNNSDTFDFDEMRYSTLSI